MTSLEGKSPAKSTNLCGAGITNGFYIISIGK